MTIYVRVYVLYMYVAIYVCVYVYTYIYTYDTSSVLAPGLERRVSYIFVLCIYTILYIYILYIYTIRSGVLQVCACVRDSAENMFSFNRMCSLRGWAGSVWHICMCVMYI